MKSKKTLLATIAAMNPTISELLHQQGEGRSARLDFSEEEIHWIVKGMAKVCLKVESEQQLIDLHNEALEAGLKSELIRDNGRTEFNGQPTLTACAIGPDLAVKIDQITGELTLY